MINSETGLVCILGSPVKHSLSPDLHNTAFQKKNLNFVYLAFNIEGSLKRTVEGLRELGFIGASVTIPFKKKIIKYLDVVEADAALMQSVNTIKNDNGLLKGYNTDIIGIEKAMGNLSLSDSIVCMIGAGGVARSVAAAVSKKGKNIKLYVYDIVESQIDRLRKDLQGLKNISIEVMTDKDVIYDSSLLVNCSPIGMSPRKDVMPIESKYIRKSTIFFDVIYTPYKTKLLINAAKKGCRIIPGFNMFLYQATAQFEIWTKEKAPVNTMRRILKNRLGIE